MFFFRNLASEKAKTMEKKKTERADLENKRSLFTEVGLVATLLLVFVAFEWKTYDKIELQDLSDTRTVAEEEMIIQTNQNTPPPPPPPPPPAVVDQIEIVDNKVELKNDFMPIDASTDQKEVIAYTPPAAVEEEVEEQEIFQIVEDKPGFPGGEEALMKYIAENVKYPTIARETGIQGTVYVTFVVEKDGSVTDVRVLRGIGGGCDEMAVSVVKSMPKWAPGKQRGKAVRVQFNLPIRFTLAG